MLQVDNPKLEGLIKQVKDNRSHIKWLEKDILRQVHKIATTLLAEIGDWKPTIDEKAVCFTPNEILAFYVWFIGKDGDEYVFKETPSTDKFIHFTYRQKIQPEKLEQRVIFPLTIFREVARQLKIKIHDNRILYR